MKNVLMITAVLLMSFFSTCFAEGKTLGQIANGVVDDMNQAKELVKNKEVQKEKKPVVEIITRCENDYITRMEIAECKLMGAMPLAKQGNFVAQHVIAQLFAAEGHKEEALKWYDECIKNPKTLEGYKKIVSSEKESLK